MKLNHKHNHFMGERLYLCES